MSIEPEVARFGSGSAAAGSLASEHAEHAPIEIARSHRTFWGDIGRRLVANKVAVAGGAFVLVLVVLARPQAAHEQLARWRTNNPAFDEIRNAPNLTPEEKRARLLPIAATLQPAMEQWYAEQLQSATVAELRNLLAGVAV